MTRAVEPSRETRSPTFDDSTSERALQVWMSRSVATIAECDQVRRFIHAPGGTWNQMVNVRFPCGADVAAFPTTPVVAREHDGPRFAPMLVNRSELGRTHGRVFVKTRYSTRLSPSWEVELLQLSLAA